jgi:comEA protein
MRIIRQLGAFLMNNRNGIWQIFCGSIGFITLVYGLNTLMIERSRVPVCSAEVLETIGQESFLNEQRITVEVAGAVREPGVRQLPAGARIAEALEKAGGFSQRADRQFTVQGLNLADLLKDGQKIYVPFEGETAALAGTSGSSENSSQKKVSINTASLQELQTLPGIGEVRAGDIIQNRPYAALEDLMAKSVLTETVFTDIKEQIAL